MAAETHDTIRTLVMRWTGSPHDAHAPAAQLRLERLLAAVDWRPPGLPPSAILLIRRLDGLPPVRAGALIAPQWEARLHDRIAALARTAARPRYGPVPHDAASILFETPADLLVSLTRDLLSAPEAVPSWTWQQAAGASAATGKPGERLATLWARHAAFLPAALAHLALVEHVQAAALLSEHDARIVLSALQDAYALIPLAAPSAPPIHALDTPAQSGVLGEPGATTQESRAQDNPVNADSMGEAGETTIQAAPPWSDWLPILPPNITPSAQVLLGWCTGLRIAPAAARSPHFARQAVQWLAQQTMVEHDTRALLPALAGPAIRPPGDIPGAQRPALPAAANAPEVTVEPVQAIGPTWDQPLGAPPFAHQVVTGWGGILFLTHMLRWLNLPESWEPALSAWAALETVALALLGGPSTPGALDDPVWRVLAALDGRAPDTPLGAQAQPTAAFRLPPDWLRQIAPSVRWQVTTATGVLRITDRDRGFLVAEVPVYRRSWVTAIEREVATYRAAGLEIEWTPGDSNATHLESRAMDDDWLSDDRAAPAVRAWLRRAGGFLRGWCHAALGDPGLSPEDAAELILRQPGKLAVSDTHIDLFLPMSAADVRLRRAGLDHDPGWVPALGYIVLFHFVE